MGIAVWTTEKSFEDLYKMADQALYKAKDKGRDRYHIILKDQDGSILHIE
ncbi:MAG: diguanylate cyclase domain-containing protein [Blautia sp.]